MLTILITLLVLFFAGPLGAFPPQPFASQTFPQEYGVDMDEYRSLFHDPSSFRHHNQFALLSVPKSGTYLALKLLDMMLGNVPGWIFFDGSNGSSLIPVAHFGDDELIKKTYENKNLPILLLYRDPRDIAVSAVHYFKEWPFGNVHSRSTPAEFQRETLWQQGTFDEKLAMLIGHPDGFIKPSLERLLLFAQRANVYLCRFENLVGPKGGGALEKQKEEIHSIAAFLTIPLSPEQLNYLCANLFGKSATFREGKIGSWKAAFKEEHKKLFKEVMGEHLIQLGYESNDQW